MSSDDKIKSFLSDLGRATLRGVRRCPKCGTYNGTRGSSCKKCNCLFKEKRKFSTEACKILTGNSTQIYSVRVHDKGPDYRGFVQLPLIQGNILSQGADSLVIKDTALCFVDSCQRLFDTSILKCHETDHCIVTPMCQHIEAAVKCSNQASPLDFKPQLFNIFDIGEDIKQEFYQLSSQSSAPLVQRVSKNVMAVKCQVSPKHPLGYLHFSFFTTKVKVDSKFYCGCRSDVKGQNKHNHEVLNKKCVHYYLCICAFASDSKLAEEFSVYVNKEQNIKVPLLSTHKTKLDSSFDGFISGLTTAEGPLTISDNQLVSILDNDLVDTSDVCDIEVEVLNESALLDVPNISISEVIDSNVQVQNLEINENGEVTIIRGINDDTLQFSDLADNLHCYTDPIDLSSQLEIIPIKKAKLEHFPKVVKQSKNRKNNETRIETRKLKKSLKSQDNATIEEKRTQLSFIQWLSSVTERINQSMHYQFNGKPDALIFHIPQIFFDCLRERISYGGTKKRLPNYTNVFVRKEAVPLGTFTKYTWHITNILQVKQIFETPLIPLEITKSFVQNRDGTFDLYMPKGDENDELRKDGLIPIKPLELKTYLKVGNTSRNQIEPTPFIIEWIPDILPLSKIGELRIRFEYGHQKGNGTKLIRIPKKSDSTCIS